MAPWSDGDLGTLLAVFAHPDDEAYLAGGLMATAVDQGRRVVCVTATSGELGFPDDDGRSLDERARLREAELAECLGVLGVTEHLLLGHPDGGCAALDAVAPVARLVDLIEEIRPDTVVTFGPDGQTYHPDHIAVSRWTTLAVRNAAAPLRLLYAAMTPEWVAEFGKVVPLDQVMMSDEPMPTVPAHELDVWFVCEGPLLDRKVDALCRQVSQVAPLAEIAGREAFARLTADEMFRAPTSADWPDG